MRNKLIFVFLAAVFVFTLSASVFAQDFAPDHHGSISVTLTEPGSDVPVADAELLLYYVATVKLNERGNLAYTYTEDFEKCGISLDDMHLASKLSLIIDSEIPCRVSSDPHERRNDLDAVSTRDSAKLKYR